MLSISYISVLSISVLSMSYISVLSRSIEWDSTSVNQCIDVEYELYISVLSISCISVY